MRGLPSRPPAGEQVLWQGSPQWRSLARRVFHVRGVALYLGFLLAYAGVHSVILGTPTVTALLDTARFAGLAMIPVLLLLLYAWRVARTTVYTVTNRRVAIQMGVALPMTLNLPFARIDGAAARQAADGTGDIILQLAPGNRVAYLILWPHARPFHMVRPQPMLRAIAHPDRVGRLLSDALLETEPGTTEAVELRPAGGPRTIGPAQAAAA